MNKDLLKTPFKTTSERVWFYEEPRGLCICMQHVSDAKAFAYISWRQIKAALKRKNKK